MSKLFENKTQRREFLEQMKSGVGVLGFGTVLATLAPYDDVIAKMSDQYVSNHVDGTFDLIDGAEPSLETDLAYLQTMNNVRGLIEQGTNEGLMYLYQTIESQLSEIGINDKTSDNLADNVNDAMVAGYLSATQALEYGAISTNEIQRNFQKTVDLEPGFISKFIDSVAYEKQYGYRLNSLNEDTKSRFNNIGTQFSSDQDQRAACAGICTIIGIAIVLVIGIIAKNAR